MSPIAEPTSEIAYEKAVAILDGMARLSSAGNHKMQFFNRIASESSNSPPDSPQSKIAATQLRYRALVEQIPAVTFMAALDESVHELYISPQIESLLGFSQQEWLDNPFLWYWQLHPDDRTAWGTEFARTCSTGVNFRSEYRFIARDGRIVWVLGECQLLTDETGRPLYLMGIAFDITDRKLAEQKLQESNAALEHAVNSERLAHQAVQRAQAALTEMNHTLEQRVAERTAELETVHAQLIQVARQAGMAEVATGVLHNVGNVLNTVNVRASLVRDKVKRSRVDGFERVVQALDEHSADLGQFLSSDERGRFLPDFIKKLARHLIQEKAALSQDLDALNEHIEHIKRLVSTQQAYAKGGTMYEPADIVGMVEEACGINYALLVRHHVVVEREIPRLPKLLIDRHKIMQVLINLINNAVHACSAVERPDRVIRIVVSQPAAGLIQFEVSDNGIGIPAENIARIFSHGFTTRADGHGFGLHGSANAAREMGGSLVAASRGAGRGATFTLSIPVKSSAPGAVVSNL